jgi:hypothetical protein
MTNPFECADRTRLPTWIPRRLRHTYTAWTNTSRFRHFEQLETTHRTCVRDKTRATVRSFARSLAAALALALGVCSRSGSARPARDLPEMRIFRNVLLELFVTTTLTLMLSP